MPMRNLYSPGVLPLAFLHMTLVTDELRPLDSTIKKRKREECIVKRWAEAAAVVLAVLGGLALGQQSPTTGREYYAQLKQAGAIPKWARNVCFTDSETDNGTFMLLAGNANSQVVLTQTFVNGTKSELISYERVQDGQYVAHVVDERDRSTTISRLNLTWETGRFWRELRSQNKTYIYEGDCEPIEGTKAAQ
jgi:hypothetical protein